MAAHVFTYFAMPLPIMLLTVRQLMILLVILAVAVAAIWQKEYNSYSLQQQQKQVVIIDDYWRVALTATMKKYYV